jgi:hypothetical protein
MATNFSPDIQSNARTEAILIASNSSALTDLFRAWDDCYEEWKIDGYQILNEVKERKPELSGWRDAEVKVKILKLSCSGRLQQTSTNWEQFLYLYS